MTSRALAMFGISILVASGVAAAPAAAVAPGDHGAVEAPLFDEDGNVIEGDAQETEVEWTGDPVPPIDTNGTFACPEVNNPPRYKLKKSVKFIIAKTDPFSSFLQPGQTAKYTTTKSNEFQAQVTVGVSAEAGAFLAKAAAKLDIQVSNKWVAGTGREVSDTNKTKKAYRVRLGNAGYRVIETMTKIVPPCKAVTRTTWDVVAPDPGDLTLGRFKN
ncbi:hypothetical protein [Pilimelia columellifera]|uniref:Uncharacterized protein n=1 Tax=Pilimelia columellifera subsp. columellifera TaxID=706583 RepID=A0ABN3N0P0_9ACTN